MSSHSSNHIDASTCPCCGPGSMTVGRARTVLTNDDVVQGVYNLTYRPFWSNEDEPMIVLVHQEDDRPVLSWSFDEAHEFLHFLDAGPVAATLCLGTSDPNETVELSGYELCLLAVAIEANLCALAG